jgi:uncharacterized protein (TIGR02145 family)
MENKVLAKFIFFTLFSMQISCVENSPENYSGLPKDIDGNVYDTVRIGNQVWMKQNLRVTRLNDGTSILNLVSDLDWTKNEKNKVVAYCWNKNDTSLIKPFGALYNEYAVASGKLAPKGWRIPNSDDWDSLMMYMKNHDLNFKYNSPTNLGDWSAKPLADSLYWEPYTHFGSVGWQRWRNNSTGFSAVPTCTRGTDGKFSFLGYYTYFWTLSTPRITPITFDQKFSNCAYIDHIGVKMTRNSWYSNTGHSVRCIKIK